MLYILSEGISIPISHILQHFEKIWPPPLNLHTDIHIDMYIQIQSFVFLNIFQPYNLVFMTQKVLSKDVIQGLLRF